MTTETSLYEYAKNGLSFGAARTAIWFYGRSLSYGELFGKIDNVADHLYSLGVREGTVVTIHLPNCPQAVMAIYAVAKLGGVCNMVHAQTPADALRENLAFTESDILITYLPQCTALAEQSFFVDLSHYMGFLIQTGFRLKNKDRRPANVPAFEALERSCPQKAVVPDQAALAEKCAVYFHSSGTTGTPKTVMHCHRALNWSAVNARLHYHLDEIRQEVLLGVLPLFHGSGFVMDYHLGLGGGSQIAIMAKWDRDLAAKIIQTQKVTNITGVPQLFLALLQSKKFPGNRLHQCFCGGDVVEPTLKRDFQSRTGIPLYEGFGLTETSSTCCGDRFNGDEIAQLSFPNCDVAILDPEKGPLTQGIGELLITSDSVMLGYLKDPEGTEATLLEWNGRIWVRTGDLGEVDEEGRIRFMERIKKIIVHNGYNIYPKEVEAVIADVAEVAEVCVFGMADEERQTQTVCAGIVLTPGADQEKARATVRAACERLLPQHAIPRLLCFVEHLPRNDMRKVDLKKMEALLRETL